MTFIFYPSLIAICRTTFVKRLLNKKIFGKIAKISFDVYIWHNLLLIIMYIGIKILDLSFDFNDFWLMIVFTLFSFIVGTISYYLIEMPINHYIKKVSSNLNNTE